MRWSSWGEFFAMGGYGLYVWTSFGATALCLALEVTAVRWRHRTALGHAAPLHQSSGGR